MKILHFLYSGLGGHGNVFFSLASVDTNNFYVAAFNGIEPIKNEYVQKCTKNNIPFEYVNKKKGLDLLFYIKLYKVIKKHKPSILFLHGGTAILPAFIYRLFSFRKIKIIVRETQANNLKTKSDWIYLVLSMLLANEMIYLSTDYKNQIKEKLSFVYKSNHSHVIPNGIDLNFFKPNSIYKKAQNITLIGMQSRVTAIKDHSTLLKAIALLKAKTKNKVILKIAGEGDNLKAVTDLSKQLNLDDDVIFTGLLNEAEIVNFLNEIDIYVHASYGETMSTAIMQAMACKKPIIASDVVGINNMLIDNVNGILVSLNNEIELAKKIDLLIENKSLAKKLAENAFHYAQQNFSNQTMYNNYLKIYPK